MQHILKHIVKPITKHTENKKTQKNSKIFIQHFF